MRGVLAGAALALVFGRGAAQTETEQQQARRNSTFVPVAAPALARRVAAGLRLLREGRGKAALERLLPAIGPDKPAVLVPWGGRETRDFVELLEAHLRAAQPAVRHDFVQGYERDAREALARAGSEARWLAGVARAFPGTAAAGSARRRLADLAIESCDLVDASRHVARLAGAERDTRATALATLAPASVPNEGWPYTAGGLDGLPLGGGAKAPAKRLPAEVGRWPEDTTLRSDVAGAVAGRDERGRPMAVVQDPAGLFLVTQNGTRFVVEHVDLRALTGLGPHGGDRSIHPCMLGNDLYVVHGGLAPTEFEDRAPAGGAELFSLRPVSDAPGLAIAWRWSPASQQHAKATVHPFVVATDRRVYVVLSEAEDRLNRRVYVACLDVAGELLWLRFVAKGAPLTAKLLVHRQEAVRQGEVRPAVPIIANGRLVVDSGLGLVAALDPIDGHIVWTFRTARLRAIKSRERPWKRAKLAFADGRIWFAPADSAWLYRLRLDPRLGDIMPDLPRHKRSWTRFLGVVPERGASYWLREGLREAGPLRVLLAPERGRPVRYDAPPLQPGEAVAVPPLLTTDCLFIVTDHSLYWLDLAKDLFYERAYDLSRRAPGPYGPAVPFAGGILVAGPAGPLLWR